MALKFKGKLLRSERLKSGLTQDQITKALFLGDTQISKYERGVQVPSAEMLKAICDYIGCDMNDLFE